METDLQTRVKENYAQNKQALLKVDLSTPSGDL